MTERPILFSGAMVRAILQGRKQQTRRALKPQPHEKLSASVHYDRATGGAMWASMRGDHGVACPYGKPGDRLWVRENGWERPERTPRMMREGADTWKRFYFDAGITEQDHEQFKEWGFKRRPSIHMPRWACRLMLEVTGVRVERLQEISEADAVAEGYPYDQTRKLPTPRIWYSGLWEAINGRGSWSADPWVWVVSFKRFDPVAAMPPADARAAADAMDFGGSDFP